MCNLTFIVTISTSHRFTEQRVLIRVISTVVIPITEIAASQTLVAVGALCLSFLTGTIRTLDFICFVAISTIVFSIADQVFANASEVLALKLLVCALWIITVHFIRAIFAVVIIITAVLGLNTPPIVTPEKGRVTNMGCTHILIFIESITTVWVRVTHPLVAEALPVAAHKAVGFTGVVAGYTHLASVAQYVGHAICLGTLTLSLTVWSGVTAVTTAAIKRSTGVIVTFLPAGREDGNSHWTIQNSFHHDHHISPCVFFSPIHTMKSPVCPVHIMTKHSHGVGVDSGLYDDLSVLSIEVRSLYSVSQGICPVNHVLVVINRKPVGPA